MSADAARHRIGTAGWSIPGAAAAAFPGPGTHLERYARVFSCAEINSTFYRAHRAGTYARWAASVPAHFRFAVKLRRTITHERKLVDCDALVRDFLDETDALGSSRGVILVQLPPSLAFDAAVAVKFMNGLRAAYAGAAVLEPRHRSWFADDVDAVLRDLRIGRVAADPALVPAAGLPGGDLALRYFRWHGWPKTYWSAYERQRIHEFAQLVNAGAGAAWCIFDNTAKGAAAPNALALTQELADT